ncbi:GGDEF domain-containing protein [Falsiroseomonas tokyonensis]|uniref:Diguanylate cyclase n=1 Tax=Falsiroseomonas tokyonensis TaxID=430521 RepID=A0ABV7BYM4_9PROT|nr:diguanylate cyclase [Falsiroseomonas tokyonensis]MBU8539961.1 diguanylate cyclase [Falsiroseomonas tokyonensis]
MAKPVQLPVFASRLRTTLITGALCLLLGAVFSTVALMRERDRLVQDHGARLAAVAGAMAARLDAGLSAWARDVALLARFAAFQQDPPDPAAARRLLEDLQTRSPEFSWIGFAGPDGRVIAATGGLLEGRDVSARPWFGGGLRGLYLGDVHPAVLLARLLPASEGGDGAYFVDAAAPVIGADGQLRGVVAGHMNWLWAEGVRQEMLRLSSERPAPELLVAGSDGNLLLGAEAERGQAVPGTAILRARQALQDGWQEEADGPLTGFAPTRGTADHPGLGWVVLARRDMAAVLEPLWTLGLWLALGTLGLAAAGGLLAGSVVARFGTALRAMNDGPGGRDAAEELDRLAATLKRLRNTAYRDPLTGLLNRAGFAAWREANPAAERDCALLALDLDGFKPINDRLGHAAGDAVLVAIGSWFEANLRMGDCAVRMGGDEFLVCLRGPAAMAESAAAEVAARFQAALTEGLTTSEGRMQLGCSIGIAIIPRDAPGIEAGIPKADAELYRVKRLRKAETVSLR